MVVGTKVTTDPESRRGVDEGVGVVTSDSLAAESYKDDSGSFGEGNRKAAVSDQPSRSTNTNNDDTSGATVLGSARNARDREDRYGADDGDNDLSTGSSRNTSGRSGNDSYGSSGSSDGFSSRTDDNDATTSRTSGSRGNDYSGNSGNTYSRSNDDNNDPSYSSGATGDGPIGGYAGASDKAQDPGFFKPKGTNISEDDNLEGETKFGPIGTRDDPSRVAERKYAQDEAQSSSGLRGAGSDNTYGALNDN